MQPARTWARENAIKKTNNKQKHDSLNKNKVTTFPADKACKRQACRRTEGKSAKPEIIPKVFSSIAANGAVTAEIFAAALKQDRPAGRF